MVPQLFLTIQINLLSVKGDSFLPDSGKVAAPSVNLYNKQTFFMFCTEVLPDVVNHKNQQQLRDKQQFIYFKIVGCAIIPPQKTNMSKK